ncbi:MAG: type II toxin-antitoxin system HigB family toxin [Candidatus Riflebacteria bacterium]|nr:type II toxin-antitoxin system HigB family toxin [Candidatus Riflebacteria bacterium]
MHIISWAKIRDFVDRHPTSLGSMRTWFDCLESRMYKDFNDLRTMFPSADRVRLKSGQDRYVFNVAGNNYRIICGIHFNRGKVYVRFVLTHAEYDKGAWKHE